MSISRLMQKAAAGAGEDVVLAEAADFDGTNDYLSRSTDMVGNADGKTFTFSAWVYFNELTITQYLYYGRNDTGPIISVRVGVTSSGEIFFQTDNTSGTNILSATSGADKIPVKTWTHILISVDLSSASNRYVYSQDAEVTSMSYAIYTNDDIAFTNPEHYIGEDYNQTNGVQGRLAHVYLDYTYRDLSVESNRRLFVDYDEAGGLIPADGQASLNPILYLPMDDPEDPGRNDGTGGDFNLNGVIARSGRGPNQYNAAASTFDSSNDWLDGGNIGAVDGKLMTCAFWYKIATASGDKTLFKNGDVNILWQAGGGGDTIRVIGDEGPSGSPTILDLSLASPLKIEGRWYHIAVSIDMSNTSNRYIAVDGAPQQLSVATYTDANLYLSRADWKVGESGLGIDGEFSDFWFDTTYIDLSADNPFYDAETGKPKFLGENGELPTGSAPLIYLPLRADDAGNNKGTGGDFTVNSGPYTGARGPSEFWGESAEFNGTDQYLRNAGFTSPAPSPSALSIAFAFKTSGTANSDGVEVSWDFLNGKESYFTADSQSGFESFRVFIADNSGTYFNSGTISYPFSPNEWYSVCIFCDGSSGTAKLYVNGVEEATDTFTPTTFESVKDMYIGRDASGNYKEGTLGFFWFNTEYIDFSQEANRLKFFDAFNYPVDLGEDGSLPTGNQPLIYINKDFHLGTNLGSGGDFTPVNAPIDGGYVKG